MFSAELLVRGLPGNDIAGLAEWMEALNRVLLDSVRTTETHIHANTPTARAVVVHDH